MRLRYLAAGLALLVLAGGVGLWARARRPPRPLIVYAPCVIGAPVQRVARDYEASHRSPAVRVLTEKPLAMLSPLAAAEDEAAVVLTMGEVEMGVLTDSGAVDRAAVSTLGRNAYQLAVVVPTESPVKSLSDLASPAVTHLAIEDPKLSTLGNRAEQALKKLGLWEAVAPKVVRFDPTENVLSQLLERKADAAIIYQNCLFTESGAAPRTVRVAGVFPADSYDSSSYQVAPLKAAAPSQPVEAFLQFLTSAEGGNALREAGLTAAR
jgi:molybdate transport system substrate-binding protein